MFSGLNRCLLVWVAVSSAAVLVGHWSLLDITLTGRGDQTVAGVAAIALTACAAWAWVVTTVVVASAVRGQVSPVRGVPVWASRAVLGACGVAVLAAAAPASADDDVRSAPTVSATRTLEGLPMPDRTTGPAHPVASEPGVSGHGSTYVVVPGDNLWAITAAVSDPRAGADEIAAASAELYALNRDAVGPDPDLVHPGLRLRLPEETP